METEKSRFTQEKETLFITLYCKAREGRVEVPGGIENSKPYTRMETDASTTALSVLLEVVRAFRAWIRRCPSDFCRH
jgi:hypothetical protein